MFAALLAAGVLAGAGACGAPTDSTQPAAVAASTPVAKPAAAKRNDPLLPRFEGRTLDGKDLTSDVFRNRRGVVFSFATSEKDADAYGDLIHALEDASSQANVAFLGLSHDPDPEAARAFAARKGFGFPIVDDRDGAISSKLRLPPGGSGIGLIDGDGYIVGAIGAIRQPPGVEYAELVRGLDEELRTYLRLPSPQAKLAVDLGVRPVAPTFEVRGLDDKPLKLASFEGKPVVVMFFLHTCPHCHEMLGMLDKLKKELASPDLVIIPISLQDRIYELEDMVEKFKLDLTVYRDPGSTVSKAYGSGGRVPDTLVLDRQHRVVTRQLGADARTESIVKMAIRQALGVPNPILLVKNGYNGSDACAVCHEQAHQTWSFTQHALAFDTLVKHGEDHNAECVGCHTVGFNQPGGYSLDQPAPHLEGVQCESCHGRGGPHQSPEFAKQGMQAVCETCHNPKHSLNFNFGERLPLISHAANTQFASMDVEQRRALLEQRDKRQRALFPDAPFVGSEACASCHKSEHELWAKSPHANAFASLAAKNGSDDADCQKCHTTGFDKTGGFPAAGDAMKGVGCESCHGPGGNHVGPDAQKPGTILALTDKCDSCVILQICGSCHDDANDPGFEFELNDKLERIRHGFRAKEGATAE